MPVFFNIVKMPVLHIVDEEINFFVCKMAHGRDHKNTLEKITHVFDLCVLRPV